LATRFAAREPLDIDKQVRDAYPEHEYLADTLIDYWGKTASILKIDGRMLRTTDRFDNILAPVPGYPIEDEVDDLSEFVQEALEGTGVSTELAEIKTFGDCLLLLALGAQRKIDSAASGDTTKRGS